MRNGTAQSLLLLILVLAGTAVPTWAQTGVIRGRVTGEAGAAVVGARVTAEGDGIRRGEVTDASGQYAITALPAGRYTLRVEAPGGRVTERTARIGVGETATADFVFSEAAVRLDPLQVVGVTRGSVPLATIPSAVTVITREQIDDQAALTPQLGAILTQLVPGLAAGTQSMSNYGQTLRGRNVAVLIDGVPQSTLRSALRDFVNIDPAAIERVEVLRGPTSVYGEGATGGVINIITRRPTEGTRFSTEVGTETSLSQFGEGLGGRVVQTASGKQGAWDYAASGSLRRTGAFFDAEGDLIPPDPHGQGGVAETNTWNLLGKVGVDLGEQRLQFTANVFRAEQDTDLATDPSVSAAEPGTEKARALRGLRIEEDHGSRNTLFNLDYTRPRLFGSRVHAQAYYRDYLTRFGPYDGREFASLGNSIIQSYVDSEKFGGRLEVETPLASRLVPTVLWGLDYTDETTSQPVAIMDPALFDQSGGLAFRTIEERPWVPPVNPRSLGAFAQVAVSPWQPLLLRGGVRHERVWVRVDDFQTINGVAVEGGELDYAPVLFNLGAVAEVTDAVNLFANFSQGFSLADIGRTLRGVGTGFVLGSRQLEAQRVDHYELGMRGSWDAVQATLSAYRNWSDLGATFNQELEIVRAPERVYGAEATLDVQPAAAWTLGGTFSWAEGENYIEGDQRYLPLDGYRIQPLKATGYVEHQTLPRWENRLQLLHSGERDRLFRESPDAYGAQPIRSYTVVDLLSRLHIGAGTLSVGVENLFNRQYFPVISQLSSVNTEYAAARGARLSVGYSVRY